MAYTSIYTYGRKTKNELLQITGMSVGDNVFVIDWFTEAIYNGEFWVASNMIVMNKSNAVNYLEGEVFVSDATIDNGVTRSNIVNNRLVIGTNVYNSKIISTFTGQTTATTGIKTTLNYPFDNYYENNKTQMLFLQSELDGPKTLKSISFNFSYITADATKRDFNNFTIKMQHTGLTSSNDRYESTTSATTVYYNVDYNMPAVTGWTTWVFQTGFSYNGIENLLIELYWGDNGEYCSSTDYYRVSATTMGFNCVTYGYSDTVTPPSYNNRSTLRPNTIITYENNIYDQKCVVQTRGKAKALSINTINCGEALYTSSTLGYCYYNGETIPGTFGISSENITGGTTKTLDIIMTNKRELY
jgi:hypothetical protein